MKENLKNKKGITLIALVITIIVLLILAIVTIRIMTNQNIIGYANTAVTAYNEAQQNEAEQLTWVEGLMKNKGGSSSSNASSGTGSNLESISSSPLTAQEIGEIVQSQENTTAEEIASSGHITIASHPNNDGDFPIIYIWKGNTEQDQNIHLIMMWWDDRTQYVYPTDDVMTGGEVKANTWYKAEFDGEGESQEHMTSMGEYTGPAPVSASDFTTIYSQTLLNKILATFNS